MTRNFNWRLVFKTMGVLTLLEAQFMLIPTFAAWWYDEVDLGAWIISSAVTWLSSWWMLAAGRHAEKVRHRGGRVDRLFVFRNAAFLAKRRVAGTIQRVV